MNSEQQVIFNEVKQGSNVLILGSAGTGKSYTLNAIVEWAKKEEKKIGITSSTGVSAINIKGRTIHSFLGIGLAKTTPYNMYTKSKKNSKLLKTIRELQILIIDELSMISAELFDKISEYMGLMRKINKPFGGVQLVLCGDMYQLPPVGGEYCFKSNAWNLIGLRVHILKKIIRQEKDEIFKSILENAKLGIVSEEHLKILKGKRNSEFGEVKPTILYSKNINVDVINQVEYEKVIKTGEKERVFQTQYIPDNDEMRAWAKLNNIPSELRLCIGAQVMITANLSVEDGFANGTRCMVSGFTLQGEPIVVLKTGEQIIIDPFPFTDGGGDEEDAERVVRAIPLKLAYALTIHKSQSCTLDAVVLDLGYDIFEYGQAYTALSRVRDLDSVRISNIRKESFKTHPDVVEFYREL